MASAAEQLASNLNFSTFAKAEDLKKRLWFTLGALLVYRLGTYIPLPGLNPDAFAQAFQGQSAGILGLFNMFDAGEDPLYIGRRLVRMAVEDIGLGDPQALVICNAAKDAYDYLGSPEGELALAQACVYLATAPKSNAVYTAYKAAMRAARENGSLLPPKHILNAPTKLMKGEGYGDGYRYDHDEPDAFSGQDYFPEKMGRKTFYDPPERGFEREIRKRLEWWNKLRRDRNPCTPPLRNEWWMLLESRFSSIPALTSV